MRKEDVVKFQKACRQYLFTLGIGDLRNYGREIGVSRPTAKKKEDLIEEIILVLSGELAPISVSKQGAPVKNDRVDDRIPMRIAEFQRELLGIEGSLAPAVLAQEKKMREAKSTIASGIVFREDEGLGTISDVTMKGQVYYKDGTYSLLPITLEEADSRIFIPESVVKANGLRDGDVISAYTCKNRQGVISVGDIEVVNGHSIGKAPLERPDFEQSIACNPKDRIQLFDGERYASTTQKFVEWLMPIAKGQRACVISVPKGGKTRFLLELAVAARGLNEDLDTLVFLVDEAPEAIGEFMRALGRDDLFYTTYDDAPERHVEVAELLLTRAKRKAESGGNVLLIVDSLNSLARAYNDTDESVGGKTLTNGLEVKTLRYMKKFFGSARCLERGGSITIIASVSVNTGNPIDDVIAAELSMQSSAETHLNDGLAVRRIYPALDIVRTRIKQGELLKSQEELAFELSLRKACEGKLSGEWLTKALSASNSYEDFVRSVLK